MVTLCRINCTFSTLIFFSGGEMDFSVGLNVTGSIVLRGLVFMLVEFPVFGVCFALASVRECTKL